MSKRMISALLVGMAAVAAAPAVPAAAADLAMPVIHAASSCGVCGCLHVSHIRHRSLESTYGLAYDPRNYDTTQPHYYFGPVRAYPRYWVEAAAPPME